VPALEAAQRGDNVVAKEMVVPSRASYKVRRVRRQDAPLRLFPNSLRVKWKFKPRRRRTKQQMIARALNITTNRQLHVKAILRKLGVHSRVEAAVIAVEQGLAGRKCRITTAKKRLIRFFTARREERKEKLKNAE